MSDPMATKAEAFTAMITPRRRNPDRPPIDDSEFVEMMWRMVRALEARAINDPANLLQVVALAQRLSEVANVAIAVNADRYAVDPRRGASINECAKLLGVSRQAAQQRRALGAGVVNARIDAAGVARFGEARREREAIQAAADLAEERLTEYRARHLRVA